MSDSKKLPRPIIEREQERPEPAAASADRSREASSHSFQDATIGFFAAMGHRAWAYADAHPHTVLYGLVGLALAILILTFGLWHAIVISIFVGVGVVVGQMRDGEGAIYRFFSRLFGRK